MPLDGSDWLWGLFKSPTVHCTQWGDSVHFLNLFSLISLGRHVIADVSPFFFSGIGELYSVVETVI